MLRVLLTIGFLQGLTMLVTVTRTKTLALLLGPEWIGLMAVVDKLLAVLAQTASLSLPYATIRYLPNLWSQSPAQFAGLMRRMRNLLILMIAAATLVGLIVSMGFPQAWGKELLPYQHTLIIAFFTLPVMGLVPFLQNAIASRLQHNASMLFALAHASVFTVATVAGAWWYGLDGLYGLYAALGLLLVIPVIRMVERTPSVAGAAVARDRAFSISLPRQIWKFSVALLALTFITPFAAVYVHYRVLSLFGLKSAGWMQAAMGLALSVRTLLGSAGAVFLTPNVNRGGTPEERMRWVTEYYNMLGVLCGVCGVGLLLFPQQVLRLLYSVEFVPATPFVLLFVVGEVVALLAGTIQALVVAFDHIGYHVFQNVVAQGIMLGVAFVLIENLGIAGAGIAGICAPLFLYVSTTLFLRRQYSLVLPARSLRLTLFVVACLGLGGFVGAWLSDLSVGVLLGKLFLYGVFLAGLGVLLGPSERAKVRTLARDLRRHLFSLGEYVRIGA